MNGSSAQPARLALSSDELAVEIKHKVIAVVEPAREKDANASAQKL